MTAWPRSPDELEAGTFGFLESDEDIHMAVERRLGEIVGAVAGKLHTGRSRNDQVATDICMAVMDRSDRARAAIAEVMAELVRLAKEHADWPMPGYTHLQRAQPVYLGHHLLAWFWMLSRDYDRFTRARDAAAVMPLGSGALAGVNWEIDRHAVAADLGFDSITVNSLDSTSNRDFVLDYLSAASICATHLSRVGSELVIWSSTEFSFCRISEPFTSGSSIMPQKQNPDSAELLRAKAPRIIGDLTTLLGVLHALPLTYGKDMQEDKEPFFDAADTTEGILAMTAGILEGITFDRERLLAASGDEMLAATEIADLLVRRGVTVPRCPRDRRRPGPAVRGRGAQPVRPQPRGDRGTFTRARRRVLRGPEAGELARIEAQRGRHLERQPRPPDRTGREPGRGSGRLPSRSRRPDGRSAGAGAAGPDSTAGVGRRGGSGLRGRRLGRRCRVGLGLRERAWVTSGAGAVSSGT